MERQVVLVVGHGSRVRAAFSEAHNFTAALSAHVGQDTVLCFLELADPDMATGLTQAARRAGAGGSVVVLPLFLGAAGHQKNDVAASLQWARQQFPDVSFRMAAALAPHANLVTLLALRVEQAMSTMAEGWQPESTGVLVVGRGSGDPTGNSEIARLAHLLYADGRFHSVEYAFQAVARPTMVEGLRRCKDLGAQQIVVAPYLLFTGDVDRDIRNVAEETARELRLPLVVSSYLGVHPQLVEVARQRLDEAVSGTTPSTCDMCKYRFILPGHDDQVGQPQTTRHLRGGPEHSHREEAGRSDER